MKKNLFLTVIALIALCLNANSQSITLIKGDIAKIKAHSKIEVAFDYSNMAVGKFDKEEDYVNKKVLEYNSNEPGKGDKWKKNWINDRKERYEPKFFELFSKYIDEAGFVAAIGVDNATYTMLVHTVFIEPGFNVAIMRRPAMVNFEITIKDKVTGNELAVLQIKKCLGQDAMGYDFDSGLRISEGYAKLGKSLGKFLVKKCSK